MRRWRRYRAIRKSWKDRRIPRALMLCAWCGRWIESRDGTRQCECHTPKIIHG
ncbi:MAG: hypothetical protein BWY85_00444 [Firmicutes bacterium ADurb.Bin506]|nr:MAG: hypothetical protein BWY85_00444 [Firmicutes bacterium ADurb.Bin506]